MSELTEDPELLDDEEEGVGGDEHYDGEAVSFITYDHALFELPEGFEFEEGEDDD